MAFSPLENFRNFLSSRPPLVLFVVCIGMMAIAFISYAYYIKYNDVYNPDANEKFNEFLDNVTKLNLCPKLSNKSWSIAGSHKPSNLNLTQILSSSQREKLDYDSEYEHASFPLTVTVSLSQKEDGKIYPTPITAFVSTFSASLLGIAGPNENKTVAFEMMPSVPLSLKCADNQKMCLLEYDMCTTVLAPAGVIPYANKQTRSCVIAKNTTMPFLSWLDISASPASIEDHPVSECGESNILLKAAHVRERLTVMLTLEKRSLVNMHLMHSSYFLFVVIITILLFGIIAGGGERKHPRNQNHFSLINSGMA